MNIDDRAKELGLKNYDTALPQEWLDGIIRETKISPYGHFVWCYDQSRIFGEAIPLDDIGWEICDMTRMKPRAIERSNDGI